MAKERQKATEKKMNRNADEIAKSSTFRSQEAPIYRSHFVWAISRNRVREKEKKNRSTNKIFT